MQMRLGSPARRDGHHVQAQPARSGGFGRHTREIVQALLAVVLAAALDEYAGALDILLYTELVHAAIVRPPGAPAMI
jgi:hypothetical protein